MTVNAILISISLLLLLSFFRLNIIAALIFSAFIIPLFSALSFEETWILFQQGLTNSVTLAFSYALIGGFAYLLLKSGFIDYVLHYFIQDLDQKPNNKMKSILLSIIIIASILSQNILPIHVAIIPILIPPLLYYLNTINIDRRAISCSLSFGLVTSYMLLPFGFGELFFYDIVVKQVQANGVMINTPINMFKIMFLPALGMLLGLTIAIFYTYKNKRQYTINQSQKKLYTPQLSFIEKSKLMMVFIVFISIQLITKSIALAALVGVLILCIGNKKEWQENNDVFLFGTQNMAAVGVIMMVASGYAEVIKHSGELGQLIETALEISAHYSVYFSLFAMLIIGLFLTIGIGSSFATVPIIALFFVPICLHLQLNVDVILCLIASSAILGDTGSPASEVTLVTSSILNTNNEHQHIKDTVIPTFIHFNVPLLIFALLSCAILM